MSTKTQAKHAVPDRAEAASDAELEQFLVADHDRIQAKLAEARASIARGEAAPMEPLHILLREARKFARAAR